MTSLQRLDAIARPDDPDDELSASAIAAIETAAVDLSDWEKAKLSQIKRIIHGDAAGNWYDDPASVHGGDASLRALSLKANVNVVPFSDTALVAVAHNLGRRPIVQVLQERLDGLYGEGGFGDDGYGSSAGLYTPLPNNFHKIFHITANSFEVRMQNIFTGEILYS